MNAFQFGRAVRIKLAAGPGMPLPTTSLSGKSTLPTQPPTSTASGTMSLAHNDVPRPQTVTGGSGTQPQAMPRKTPATFNGGQTPSFWSEMNNPKAPGYTGALDRWYNPWTKQQVTEKGEHGLMRAGQIAMGTGLAAGAAAGGLAAAPTVASTLGLGGGGTAAATAGTGAAAASQTPAGQNALNALSPAVAAFGSRAGDLAARANVMGQRAFETLPKSLQHYHHAVEKTPFSQMINPATGIAKHMNPVNTVGNLTGMLPHSVTLPVEGVHLAMEGAHELNHGPMHAGMAGH